MIKYFELKFCWHFTINFINESTSKFKMKKEDLLISPSFCGLGRIKSFFESMWFYLVLMLLFRPSCMRFVIQLFFCEVVISLWLRNETHSSQLLQHRAIPTLTYIFMQNVLLSTYHAPCIVIEIKSWGYNKTWFLISKSVQIWKK